MAIRNVAIIAHVDHGKTTLVDALLKFSAIKLKKNQSDELIMDSTDLERERGITIFSKNASIQYEGTKINIIDTPGHADFGGEVERVLKMADGCLLLIDAAEGPRPQTLFVLKKALLLGHKIIVVVNKIDKKDARPNWALEKTYELFFELGANNEQIEFPILYAAGSLAKAGEDKELSKMKSIEPILEAIIKYIPEPQHNAEGSLQMLVVNLTKDSFRGRIAIGRVYQGKITAGQTIARIDREGKIKTARITALMSFEGLAVVDAQEIIAGDIAAVAGLDDITIGETVADKDNPEPLPLLEIEKPTVKMDFMVNTSPFAGREGRYCTSRNLRERLYKELETDVALQVEDSDTTDTLVVAGRGELHLSILIERMRREGYEFQVGNPRVITKEVNDRILVPYEQLFIEAPTEYSGAIIEKIGRRRGEMKNMRNEGARVYLDFIIPTQGLFGYRRDFLTDTKGTGIMNTLFEGYKENPGAIDVNSHGSLIAASDGVSNSYGLLNVVDRGVFFIDPGQPVYEGQIVGQNNKNEDIEVNVCKTKRLSNMRSKGEGNKESLEAARVLSLEEALEFIGDDELVEITPQSIRLRKKYLTSLERKRAKS
ncbi:MAG: GTP-binding protein TypA [Candidatus Wildermuthbacteria bacterium GWA2_46_15]|uniref:50S ribosomal subunit assembly factor BipA n=1 Tax=Candidatus Wildermuthbacteria bacterium GWA2_46_15 TaxID=1802443 RepID=A0A1G2QP74_9BACT|nr:MAG: GTP-binding protein TypA [Candidatus Wildermuthbacteria bacterium GWA2_46_15]